MKSRIMKSHCCLISILLLFIACDETNEEPITAETSLIVGKWKQTEAYISAGGPQYWVEVQNGEEIEFFEDKTFCSNRFTECTDGNFTIGENDLLLEYSCADFDSRSENEEGFITYKLEVSSDYIILTPTSGPIYIEGCSYKYQRIE